MLQNVSYPFQKYLNVFCVPPSLKSFCDFFFFQGGAKQQTVLTGRFFFSFFFHGVHNHSHDKVNVHNHLHDQVSDGPNNVYNVHNHVCDVCGDIHDVFFVHEL